MLCMTPQIAPTTDPVQPPILAPVVSPGLSAGCPPGGPPGGALRSPPRGGPWEFPWGSTGGSRGDLPEGDSRQNAISPEHKWFLHKSTRNLIHKLTHKQLQLKMQLINHYFSATLVPQGASVSAYEIDFFQ